MAAQQTSSSSNRLRLRLAASLWTLAGHPRLQMEWPLERKLAEIKAAGFEGVQAAYRPELPALLKHHGLAWLGAFDAVDPRSFPRQIEALVSGGALFATAQVGEHDTSTAQAVRLIRALQKAAHARGLLVQVETHRDTALETPEKFEAIRSVYRRQTGDELPVTWDHSHFALVKHLRSEDFTDRLLRYPRSLRLSRCVHLRPFNGHHCQIAVLNRSGQSTPEFRAWLKFASALLKQWKEGANSDEELWAVVEQGGGSNGYQLSVFNPAWMDAVACAKALRRLAREIGLRHGVC